MGIKIKGSNSGDVTIKCVANAGTNVATFPATTGDVVTTGDSLTVSQGMIANQAINEAKLQVSNSPTNGYILTARSGNTGGMTWEEATSFNPDGAVTFNESGNSVDFRVEGNTTPNLLFVDGSADAIGINTNIPGSIGGEKLQVNGNVRIGDIHAGYGENSTSHSTNVVFGSYSGQSFTDTGRRNVAIGHEAGRYITTGDENVCIGYRIAMNSGGVTGNKNIGIGDEAMQDLTTGEGNTFVGRKAGHAVTTGSHNTAIGEYAMYAGTMTGVYNDCMGYSAGASMTSASNNVCIGKNAGANMTTPQTNTCVGVNAGLGLIGGGGNVLLGYNAGYTGSPSGNLSNNNYQVVLGNNSITDLWCADTSISSSDQRDKTDITDFTHGLDWVTQMRPVTYKWDKRSWYVDFDANPDTDLRDVTTDGTHKKDRINIGLLAQEIQAIEKADGFATDGNNELLSRTTDDGQQIGLKYERIVPVLINAIKELKAEVDTLKTKVAALEAG